MKFFKSRVEFLLEAENADPKNMWKAVLNNKKNFVDHYKDLLIAHKKAESKNLLNDELLNGYKQLFLKLCTSYKIGDLNTLKSYTKKFETNFLGADVKTQNEFYVKYFEQEGVKNLQDLQAKTLETVPPAEKITVSNEIKAKQEDVTSLTSTPTSSTTTAKFVISDEDKKLLMTPKGLQTIYFGRESVNNQGLVKFIQKFLATGETTGVLTPKTDEAIKKYQQSKNLNIDGKIGSKTWTSIFNDCGIEYNESYFNPLLNSGKTSTTNTTSLKNVSKNQKITNIDNLFESITDFKGIEMIIDKPFDKSNNTIVAKFKKGNEILKFKGKDTVTLFINPNTGKMNKTTMSDLLKNLTSSQQSITDSTKFNKTEAIKDTFKNNPNLSTKPDDILSSVEIDEIVGNVADWLDGDVTQADLLDITTEMSKLTLSIGKGSKTFKRENGETISAYDMFKHRYEAHESDEKFVDELNSVGGSDDGIVSFGRGDSTEQTKVIYSKLIDLLKKLGEPETTEWHGYDPSLY